MKTLGEFLHMGGYALYVWGAYGLTAIVMAWNALGPLLRERSLLRDMSRTPPEGRR